MKTDPLAGIPITSAVKSEVNEPKKEIIKAVAGASSTDSFVEASSDQAKLFSHPDAGKLNTGSGVVSGLDVSTGQTPSDFVHVSQGSAVNPAGKLVDAGVDDSIVHTSNRASYFDGKKLDAQDLQVEQDYKRDTRRLAGTGPFETSRTHDSNSGESPRGIDQGLLSSTSRIAAEFALYSPVIARLCELTGKSTQEIQALLNQYGVNPNKLSTPPDQNVVAFTHDPAFAAWPPQDLLKALYGQ